jgi:hypothetical protein
MMVIDIQVENLKIWEMLGLVLGKIWHFNTMVVSIVDYWCGVILYS